MNLPHPIHHSTHRKKRNARQYLIITTLIIGAIFLVLLINESKNDPSGSAVLNVKELGGSILEEGGKIKDVIGGSDKEVKEEEKEENEVRLHRLSMRVDKIPPINQEKSKVGLFDMSFTDFTTEIKINNEQLSLHDLNSVVLTLSEFEGNFGFNENGLSLDGKVSQLIVNGVTLSADDGITVSFEGLTFNTLSLAEVEFEDLAFSQSKGLLIMEEKLSFGIDDDEISIGLFEGSIMLDRTTLETITLDGQVDSLNIEGIFDLAVE
jgi:hypothetical protein